MPLCVATTGVTATSPIWSILALLLQASSPRASLKVAKQVCRGRENLAQCMCNHVDKLRDAISKNTFAMEKARNKACLTICTWFSNDGIADASCGKSDKTLRDKVTLGEDGLVFFSWYLQILGPY